MHALPSVKTHLFQAIYRGNVDAVFQKPTSNLIFLHFKNIEADLLILLLKVRYMPIHVNIAQSAKDGDIQLGRRVPYAFLHIRHRVPQLLDAKLRFHQKRRARLRQVAAARRAADQSDADRLFELLHLHTERRLCDVRFLCGEREIPDPAIDDETFQLMYARQFTHAAASLRQEKFLPHFLENKKRLLRLSRKPPEYPMVETRGIEPLTSCMPCKRSPS